MPDLETNPVSAIAAAARPGSAEANKNKSAPVANNQSSSRVTVALCFFAILFDGLDTTSIGVAGPAIAAQFGVTPASLTPAFVMTSVGAVIGYLLSGSLVARWKRRAFCSDV